MVLRFRVWGLGFRAAGLLNDYSLWGSILGCPLCRETAIWADLGNTGDEGLGLQGLGFGLVQGLGFRVWGKGVGIRG